MESKINKLKYFIRNFFETRDDDLISLIKLKSKDNDLEIIDGGFYRGYFSEKIIRSFPNANLMIHGFEPNIELSHNYSKLVMDFINSEKIIINNLALSKTKEVVSFYMGKYKATSSLFERPEESGFKYYPIQAEFDKEIAVKTISLDQYFRDKNINYIDLIKLDLQGGELDALEGSREILHSKMVDIIYAECVFVEKYKDQPKLYKLWEFMENYSYSLFSLENIKKGNYNLASKQIIRKQWNQADAIFVSPNIRDLIEKSIS